MTALRVGIVDDSDLDRDHLARLLERYEHEHDLTCAGHQYADGAALLDNYRANLDVVFLDIIMPGVDGMRTAAAIRTMDTKVVLIFVTNTAKYATSGYAVQAHSYVLKPVTYFAFETEMNRCLNRLSHIELSSILLGVGTGLRRVDVADVVYVESSRHRITVHTVDGVISFSGTLKEVEDQLASHSFFRSNSGYVLNLQHIKAIKGDDAVMSNGDILKISRSRKKSLLETLNHYISGQLV